MSANIIKPDPKDADGSNLARAAERIRRASFAHAHARGVRVDESSVMALAIMALAEEVRAHDPLAAFVGLVAGIGKVARQQQMELPQMQIALNRVLEAAFNDESFLEPQDQQR